MSSGAVYGRQHFTPSHVAEDYTGAPNVFEPDSAYPEGKRMSELLGAIYTRQHGLEVKVPRIFPLVGPYLPLDAHFAIGNFIRDAMAGGPIKINGDGTPYRSYLYAADLTIWLWTILVRGVSNRPYNVGSRKAAEHCRIGRRRQPRPCRAKCRSRSATSPTRIDPAARYVPETSRAQSELHLRESDPALEEAIRRTAKWHQQEQDKSLKSGAEGEHIQTGL
jgi:nucleoside-diphosphate-sugar epimerase